MPIRRSGSRTQMRVHSSRREGKEMTKHLGVFDFPVAPTPTFSAVMVPHRATSPTTKQAGTKRNKCSEEMEIKSDREVIRCKTCGLVQFRTQTGNCRRCVHLLPPKGGFLISPPEPQELPGDARQLSEKLPNREAVENIGQRVQQLRESRGMTQTQLHAHSRVSRSYLSRIESGQMTPSLGTLEKFSEALGVGLNRFFAPEKNGEALLDDPFIQVLQPFLRQLDWEQWQSILKRLAAISDHISNQKRRYPFEAPGRQQALIKFQPQVSQMAMADEAALVANLR